ncbi:MAG: hypothetical protein V2I33_21740, partial [Kangiellaceae bacterium]|nr:hypothetical protein [Kangiellaceae bacterium]
MVLRNMYAESKYREMLGLRKDEFVKVWDATANKLEVNRENVRCFISKCLQTKSFMDELQSTKNEIDFASEVPTP